MRCAVVNPIYRTVNIHYDLHTAKRAAALGKVDHGVVCRGVGIIVDEFGLFVPPDKQAYFAIGRHLYAGSAVLYAFNDEGETIDLTTIPTVRFFRTNMIIEKEIEAGTLDRPVISLNGEILWQWPEPGALSYFIQ